MTQYRIGMRAQIVGDCRPWWKRLFTGNFEGKTGILIENTKIEGFDNRLDLTTPVFQVGKYKIAGFECWWEPLERDETRLLHARRHIKTLENLIKNRPDDLIVSDWKDYLELYKKIESEEMNRPRV